MNTKTLATIAIGLWVVSAAFIGFKFVTGSTVAIADGRQAIVLEESERNFVLAEMRAFLVAVHGIIEAVNNDDMATVKEIAHKVGMAEAEAVPAPLMLKLPIEFKDLGFTAHKGFDDIVIAADLDGVAVMGKLEENLTRCIACHASYQLTQAK